MFIAVAGIVGFCVATLPIVQGPKRGHGIFDHERPESIQQKMDEMDKQRRLKTLSQMEQESNKNNEKQ